MRRLARILGTLMIAAGALTLVWVVVVWRWEDPFTALYTHVQQGRLAHAYDRRAAAFAPRAVHGNLASMERTVAGEARAYARTLHTGDPVGRSFNRSASPPADGTFHNWRTPRRLEVNASHFPSGDHACPYSAAAPPARRRVRPPSVDIAKISELPRRSDRNAISRPSGDHGPPAFSVVFVSVN